MMKGGEGGRDVCACFCFFPPATTRRRIPGVVVRVRGRPLDEERPLFLLLDRLAVLVSFPRIPLPFRLSPFPFSFVFFVRPPPLLPLLLLLAAVVVVVSRGAKRLVHHPGGVVGW